MARSFKEKFERLSRKQEDSDERTHQAIMQIADTLAIFGGQGLAGFLHGRYGGMPDVLRMPVDGLVGALGGVASWGLLLTGYGEIARPINSFSSSMGGYLFGGVMADWGQSMREAAEGDNAAGLHGVDKDGKQVQYLGREYNEEEAKKAGVQKRRPILAGDREVRRDGRDARRGPFVRPNTRGSAAPMHNY